MLPSNLVIPALLAICPLVPRSPLHGSPSGQDGSGGGRFERPRAEPEETLPPIPAEATTQARATWEALCAAARTSSTPIQAFQLKAEVRTRDGVQTNDLKIDYRYLAPGFIRFGLPSGRETGRGPGVGSKAYWLRDGDEVVVLDGREHSEDRRQVDAMAAIARNFIALSDPKRIRLTRLEELPAAPPGLPADVRREAKKLSWIRVASASFALVKSDPRVRRPRPGQAEKKPIYVVEMGLDERTHLPAMAVIRPAREGEDASAAAGAGGGRRPESASGVSPMLIRLTNYQERDGFLVPHTLLVHHPERPLPGFDFTASPAQEIYVVEARLRPNLQAESFLP